MWVHGSTTNGVCFSSVNFTVDLSRDVFISSFVAIIVFHVFFLISCCITHVMILAVNSFSQR
jgi:hypothetical protein